VEEEEEATMVWVSKEGRKKKLKNGVACKEEEPRRKSR